MTPRKGTRVCPKPSQSSEANSSYPCGNTSSRAVAELTYLLLRVMSLQMTLTANYNNCVSGRRKCRPRSELILAYQCTVHLCGKKYASSHAGLVPAQKKTLTSSLLFQVMNTDSSVDKGSQGPLKRRPRGVYATI